MAEAKSPPKPRTYTVSSEKHPTVTLYRHDDAGPQGAEWRFCTSWIADRRPRSIMYVVRAPYKPGHPWLVEEWTKSDGLIGTNMGDTMREAIEHALTSFVYFVAADFSADPDISLADYKAQLREEWQKLNGVVE